MSDFILNSTTMEDNILLHLAVIEENQDVVRFLLKHGALVNGRAPNKMLSVQFPTDLEHKEHLKSTLGEIVKTEGESDDEKLESIVAKSTTPLHLAARQEKVDLCELLLVHGADLNTEMEGGETPLIVAVIARRQSIVDLLVLHGADVNARTSWGKTALHYAAQTGQKAVLNILLNNEGNINATTCQGYTPLHLAVEHGQKEIVDLLLSRGADLNIETKSNATALQMVVMAGNKDILEVMIGYGADVNSIIKNGHVDLSPFKKATEEDEYRAYKLVEKYTSKNWMSWYSTVVRKLYKKKKSKRSSLAAAFDAVSLT